MSGPEQFHNKSVFLKVVLEVLFTENRVMDIVDSW